MLADPSRAAMVLALMDGERAPEEAGRRPPAGLGRSRTVEILQPCRCGCGASRGSAFRNRNSSIARRGALGAALLDHYKRARWLLPVEDSRKLVVTPPGKSAFARFFDIDTTSI
jgi:hypothetical protein